MFCYIFLPSNPLQVQFLVGMGLLLWYLCAISCLWSINAEQCTPNPCQNGGQCIPDAKNSTAYTCKCAIHFEGQTCENDIDRCRTNPCQNGGSCTNGINNYTCHCAEGFSGKNCETDNDMCRTYPCQNGGTCANDINNYTCHCAEGFSGYNCETDNDMCRTNPCQNGGSCTNGINNYTCQCAKGFSGINCETDNDTCRSSPCLHGGNCTNDINAYTCTCTKGFSGKSCEVDNDTCRSNPCLNGGNCSNLPDSYKCICPPGYDGQNCDIDRNLCRSHPCKNDGTCQDGANTYNCVCPEGFNGTNCEFNNQMCASKPCKNNAICENKPNDYICHCPEKIIGRNCSIDQDMCRTSPCQQGGKCTNQPSTGTFTCDCPRWALGETCEGSVCASGSVDTNCEITNASILSKVFDKMEISPSENSPATLLYTYVGNNSVTFTNLKYNFGISKVIVQVNGSITVQLDSLLTATSFDFNATSVINVADTSSLNTTAMGLLSPLGAWGNSQDGASHIGIGGSSRGDNCFSLVSQDWKLPQKFRHKNEDIPPANVCGTGTVDVRGGGTIALTARVINLQGRLLAVGGPAAKGGGGAGGSIDILVTHSVSCIFIICNSFLIGHPCFLELLTRTLLV